MTPLYNTKLSQKTTSRGLKTIPLFPHKTVSTNNSDNNRSAHNDNKSLYSLTKRAQNHIFHAKSILKGERLSKKFKFPVKIWPPNNVCYIRTLQVEDPSYKELSNLVEGLTLILVQWNQNGEMGGVFNKTWYHQGLIKRMPPFGTIVQKE